MVLKIINNGKRSECVPRFTSWKVDIKKNKKIVYQGYLVDQLNQSSLICIKYVISRIFAYDFFQTRNPGFDNRKVIFCRFSTHFKHRRSYRLQSVKPTTAWLVISVAVKNSEVFRFFLNDWTVYACFWIFLGMHF